MSSIRKLPRARVEKYRSRRDHQREQSIHEMPRGLGPTARCHQSPNDQCIKRLVQDDHQKCAQSSQRSRRPPLRLSLDTGGQGDAIDQGVQRQTSRRTDPRQTVIGFFGPRAMISLTRLQSRMGMIVMSRLTPLLRDIMMVEMKEALNEKHHDKSTQDPTDRSINALELIKGVRQQVENSHAEHQSSHEAGRQLQPSMRQPDEQGNPSASEGRRENEQAINREQLDRGHRKVRLHCQPNRRRNE